MPGETEEIKRRLDIVEFIGEYLPLVRAGGPNMKARCPFHQEKTPSFYISKERQMWHCFGCGEGGDVFSFIMKHEGLEFPEALKLLAERTGVQLAQWNPKERSERMRLFEIVEYATKVFEKYLRDSAKAAHVRAYLEKRGVSLAMRDAFRLGYAPEGWDTLIQHAGQRGIGVPELVKAGLVLQSDRGGYDRFRNRLMFPIRDVHGAVVGFTARTLTDDPNEPKYINTPQTPLYNKSAVLYGLDRARQSAKKADLAVVVEGNMDVIACHQAGFENTIAVSGTAFTREQLDLIRRFTMRIAVAFDADAAGVRAAEKGIDLAIAEGLQVRVIQLPEGAGKDPDEAIKKDPAVWKHAVEQAMPVMDWFFGRAFHDADLEKPEAKSAIGRMLLPRIARIPDAIERTHWIQQLSQRLKVPEDVLRGQLPGAPKPKRPAQETAADPKKPVKPSRETMAAEEFLGLLISAPARLPEGMAAVAPEMIADPDLADLYRSMIVRYTGGEQPVPDPHAPEVPASVLATLSRVILRRERASVETPRPDDELRSLSAIIRTAHSHFEQKRLADLLRDAEARGDNDAVRSLTQQIQALISEGPA
ncbi:DNA primase [Patescibacteria group bacterium]|nr:MAG: DNA primase [Patescibacteria group bacterium]